MLEKQNNVGLPIVKMILASALLVGAMVVSYKTADSVGTDVLKYSYANGLESHAFASTIAVTLGIWWVGFFVAFTAYLFYMASVIKKLPPQTAMFKANAKKLTK